MQRDLTALADKSYDIAVLGGGIYGACVAWEATLRGLAVVLIEKADFGSATSANSLKVIHGGFRYLQHADLIRLRVSSRERRNLMRVAPHLVHPLPVLLPTYGHRLQGKEVFSLALRLNDLINLDRNHQQTDPQKYIPRGRTVSRQECLRLLPGIVSAGLTGGAIFYDAQVYNSERLLLAFLRSAAQAGAQLANYVEVMGFLQEQGRVSGVVACDRRGGERFDIRAKTVVNTCGPWVNRVLGLLGRPLASVRFAKAVNLITRPLFSHYAVGLASRRDYRDVDALFNKGRRFLFVAPWRGQSLIGTTYAGYDADPDAFHITEHDLQDLLEEINRAYPPANLKREEVAFIHGGLLPVSSLDPTTPTVQLAKHHQLRDHRYDGLPGLLSVVGVKYTTARHVAEQVVDYIFATWGYKPRRSMSSVTPLYGGQIERFDTFVQTAIRQRPYGMEEETVTRLVYNYGSSYPNVLQYMQQPMPAGSVRVDGTALLQAEILHGIREEMAQKLTDIVLRRTDLGATGHPGKGCLRLCVEIMGAELGWSPAQMEQELREAEAIFAAVKDAA